MVYVNASSDESCDLPMCESNAMGIPAVVFDCRGQYSDHCQYIKYGIVVNDVEDFDTFGKAMILMDNYHFFTRILRLNYLLPNMDKMKFYDFPMSLAEFENYCKDNKIKVKKEFTTKEWHKVAIETIFRTQIPSEFGCCDNSINYRKIQ